MRITTKPVTLFALTLLAAQLACSLPSAVSTPSQQPLPTSEPTPTPATPPLDPGMGGVLSPDGTLVASVEPVFRIVLRDASGTFRPLVEAHWIAGFDWLPDSKHIVYSDKTDDGTGAPVHIQFDLYIVNVDTGVSTKLNDPSEDLSNPVVSPTGEYIALDLGTNYGDACGVDRALAFLQLDPATYTRKSLSSLRDFSGLPRPGPEIFTDPIPTSRPGTWRDATTFDVAVRIASCEGDLSGEGIYAADVLSKSMTRVGDIPASQ